MKLFILLLSLFNIVTLSNTYQTKEQQFITVVENAYDEYVFNDYSNAAGDLIIVVGNVNEDVSFSVYFRNIGYPKYQVKIIKEKSSTKEYILSNYDDYQIYYNIEVKRNTKYYIELINSESKITYNRYYIIGNNNMDEFDSSLILQGNATNNFPYETKLKNKLSFFQLLGIFVGITIILEIILSVIVFISRRNKMKLKNNNIYTSSPNEVIFEHYDYEVKDQENEN